MIEAARAALLAIDIRRDELAREEDILEELCLVWERLVIATAGQEALTQITDQIDTARAERRAADQPGQVEVSVPSPAPVSQPSAGGTDAEQSGAAAPVSGSVRPPAASLTCPECDFVGRTDGGLGVHRRRKHGVMGATATTAEIVAATGEIPPPRPNGKATHPSRTDKFLCGRNCGESFLSRAGRDEHESEAKCSPKPTRPPVDRSRASLQDFGRRRGAIAGMGE